MLTLYDYWRSSASYRVRIALGYLGLEWEAVPVNLLEGAQRSADHLVRNPQGLVPVLQVDGANLTQSLAIIEYLDEVHGHRFLPADPVARAKVRALSYAIAMEIHPICNLRVSSFATRESGGAITTQAWMRKFIGDGLADFETMLEGGDYCAGDRFSMADICLVPQIYNARRWGVDLSALPKTIKVLQTLEAMPAVQTAHPDRVAQ